MDSFYLVYWLSSTPFFSSVRGQENGLDGAKAGGVAGRGMERGRRGRGRGRGEPYC